MSILSPFSNRFNNFNNIVAQLLDSIFHMTLNYFEVAFLA